MDQFRAVDGSRWALFRAHDVPFNAPPEEVLLRRWRIVQTPLFGVYLHRHIRPDWFRDMHDHPYSFVTWVLRGAYRENRIAAKPLTWRQWSVHYMRAEWPHSILELTEVPTWTLMFVGRRRRDWGFVTDDGWVSHKTYLNLT